MHVSTQKKTALEVAECGTLCAELFIEALEARIGLKCTSQLKQGGFLHALDLGREFFLMKSLNGGWPSRKLIVSQRCKLIYEM